VEVITAQRAGIYDVRVIRADRTDALIAWLNDHGFHFGPADEVALQSYVDRGWCFVVSLINPAPGQRSGEIAVEGLAAPLILRFPSDLPVYPLALTGTGGHDTEILIYLAADQQMSAGGRLPLRYAGPMGPRWLSAWARDVNVAGFFDMPSEQCSYLSKFRGRLSPEQMRTDLVFAPDPDGRPYREIKIVW